MNPKEAVAETIKTTKPQMRNAQITNTVSGSRLTNVVPPHDPPRDAAVPKSLNSLNHSITSLAESLNDLVTRLNPVCRQEPSSDQKDGVYPSTGCALADQLNTMEAQTARSTSAVRETLRLLEL